MASALLVGLGSVGKKHLEQMLNNFSTVHIVDTKFEDNFPLDFLDSKQIQCFSHVNQLPRNQTYDLAVIATWGPSHLEITEKIIQFQPGFLLIEKPVESSLEKVDLLEMIIGRNMIPSAINFPLRYGTLMNTIREILQTKVIGDICNVVVSGGAKCIATNGIHYLDLFMFLFDEKPQRIISDLVNNSINPRNSDLAYIGGVASFIFSADRILTINFSNRSFAETNIEIIFEQGRLTFADSELKAWKVSESSLIESRPVNRSVKFEELFVDLRDINTAEGLSQLYKTIIDNPNQFNIANFTESTRQIIKACITNESCQKLLPNLVHKTDYYNFDWKIS